MLKENNLQLHSKNDIRDYTTYSSIQDLKNQLAEHQPISVVILQNCKHVVSIANKKCIALDRKGVHEILTDSIYYYWSVDEKDELCNHPDENEVLSYGLFLPWYEVGDNDVITRSITSSYKSISLIL